MGHDRSVVADQSTTFGGVFLRGFAEGAVSGGKVTVSPERDSNITLVNEEAG